MKKSKKIVYRIVNSEGDCHQAFYTLKEAKKALKQIKIYKQKVEL